jgi:hypothetical protein
MNAAQSPFLLLPPEVKGRIYDYAFGGNAIHVTYDICPIGKVRYRLHKSRCVQDLSPPQKITFISPSRESKLYECPDERHHDCVQKVTRRAPSCCDMPLSLLQVCRQVYHEAALKPFSQTTFLFDERQYLGSQILWRFGPNASPGNHALTICVS